ncbi:DUF4177 domain-containing protein [Verrucomicrobiales bacterium BCK34]|nr:DUF4177 domain-containing protein [Verrucomicrobiales bacterium BCK34]
MNPKIEYKTVVLKVSLASVLRGQLSQVDDELQRLGAEGWKLVSVWPIPDSERSKTHFAIHYFERQSDPAFV